VQDLRLETLAVHAGRSPDSGTGAIIPPIHPSVTFERDADGSYPRGFIYTAKGNPNRMQLEACLSAIDGGKAAAAFSSGMAAIRSVLEILEPGDHVVVPNDAFAGTLRLVTERLARRGLQYALADMTDLAAVEAAMTPRTRMLWVETLSNPLLRVTDIAQLAELAHRHQALCACDNTLATPILVRPLLLGVDLVVHSTTKLISGHSDALGGVVVSMSETGPFESVRQAQLLEGSVPSPFDCWLIHRGLSTLPYRVDAMSDHALQIATHLERHPAVTRVHYPGLDSHPGHLTALRLMPKFGAMLSFEVTDGASAAKDVAAHVNLFLRATSFGGAQSLIEHRASSPIQFGLAVPDSLLRLSIGLEHPDDLISDLDHALAAAIPAVASDVGRG